MFQEHLLLLVTFQMNSRIWTDERRRLSFHQNRSRSFCFFENSSNVPVSALSQFSDAIDRFLDSMNSFG